MEAFVARRRVREATEEAEKGAAERSAGKALRFSGQYSLGYKVARLASGLSANHDGDPEAFERDFLWNLAEELHGLASLAFAMETNDDITPNQLNGLIYSLKIRVEAAADLFWEMRQARTSAAKEAANG